MSSVVISNKPPPSIEELLLLNVPFVEITPKNRKIFDGINITLWDGSEISIIICEGKYEMFPFNLQIYDSDFCEFYEEFGEYDILRLETIEEVNEKIISLRDKIQNI